jgi:anti-sigma B factor antagonist
MARAASHEESTLLSVNIDRSGSGIVFRLHGELDLSTAPALRESLSRALADECSDIVLDLAGLDYLDSTGLSLFVGARNRAAASGVRLRIRNPQRGTRRLLEITNLQNFFDIDDNE